MKKKVLLAIQSSNQELYKKNTEVLKDVYRRMKETFNLDTIEVDVISFTAGEKTEFIDDTLYIDCPDDNLCLKNRVFMEYLLQHPEYDYIVKTNATTVVNLGYINAVIRGNIIERNAFYGSYLFWDYWHANYIYVSGNFIMGHGDDFRNMLCDFEKYDNLYDVYKEKFSDAAGGTLEKEFAWKGIPDDFLWGAILNEHYKNITIVAFEEGICLNAQWRKFVPFRKADYNRVYNDRNAYAYIKTELPIKERLKIEPFLIASMAKIMMDNPVGTLECIGIEWLIINEDKEESYDKEGD